MKRNSYEFRYEIRNGLVGAGWFGDKLLDAVIAGTFLEPFGNRFGHYFIGVFISPRLRLFPAVFLGQLQLPEYVRQTHGSRIQRRVMPFHLGQCFQDQFALIHRYRFSRKRIRFPMGSRGSISGHERQGRELSIASLISQQRCLRIGIHFDECSNRFRLILSVEIQFADRQPMLDVTAEAAGWIDLQKENAFLTDAEVGATAPIIRSPTSGKDRHIWIPGGAGRFGHEADAHVSQAPGAEQVLVDSNRRNQMVKFRGPFRSGRENGLRFDVGYPADHDKVSD